MMKMPSITKVFFLFEGSWKIIVGLTQNHAHKRRGSIDSDEDEREDKGYANNKLTFKYV
jgi:hypothetical protein